MEQWEALIEGCPSPPDLRNFNKLVQSAEVVVLKEDLAQFEIEWIIQTILFKPLHLISVVTNKRNDDLWTKAIGDAFKLLTEITKRFPESLQLYYEDIVTICLLPFDTLARRQALVCASEIARVSSAGARDAQKHINSLEEVATCRAPLIALVGTICEHHPEVVMQDFNRIWRIFLNLLESNKNTDTITSALLQGILSLFKNFGSDLPMAELNSFYDQMTTEFVGISKCEDVILNILSHHANLFRERLSRDSRSRERLWLSLQENFKAKSAVESVYRAICGVLDASALQKIITSEIIPHVSSHRTQVKYTALRILTYIRTNKSGVVIEMADFDVQVLECELRSQEVSYDTAEAISWCIESNLPDSDTLLHTAIAFYTNIPTLKRKEIVVYGILNAPEDLRTSAITLLISESTISEDTLERYLPLWRELFDHNSGKDSVIMEKSRSVVDEFVAYFNFVVRSFLDEQSETIPDKLTNLLNLTHHVLTLSPDEFSTEYFGTSVCLVRELVEQFGPSSAMVAAGRAAGGSDICRMIPIDRCEDEALLCEACLAIMQSDIDDIDNVMMALQIIFSRNDVEPKTLCQALKRLEGLLSENKNAIDKNVLKEVIQKIQRLRDRKDLADKEARVLHRDVLMFLGKYGTRTDMNNNVSTSETTLIVKLKNALALNLPCPVEGNTYKINLQEILQLALNNEDSNVLQTMLSIICANLTTRPNPHLRLALTRVVVSLARCHSRGDDISPSVIESAVMLCDDIECVTEVLKYISEERSPGVRKMLSDALEGLLKGPDKDDLLNSVTERAMVMCHATTPTIKRAGLDITNTLVLALKENNQLTITLLPNILVTVSKTFEIDSETTFKSASDLFLEKIALFDENTLKKLTKDLMTVLLSYKLEIKDEIAWRTYKKTVKIAVEFIRKVLDHTHFEYCKLSGMLSECHKQEITIERSLYVLAEIRRIFDLNTDYSSFILRSNSCEFVKKLLATEFKYGRESFVRVEAILRFMEEYADVLLELQYKEVLAYLGTTIANISPTHVQYVQKVLNSCMSTYAKKFNNPPQGLTVSLTEWCQNLPLDQITESMSKELFDESHAVTLRALKVMLDIFNLTDLSVLTNVSVNARKWPTILLRIFSNESSRDDLKMKLSHVTDVMTVAVKFATVTDVKKILLEGVNIHGVANEKIGLKFCKFLIHVFCEVLVREPFLLLDDDMTSCCIIVNDVVKYVLKKKMSDQVYENVLELVDKLWPIYEPHATFNQKHSLLLDVSNLPKKLSPESNPMQWVTRVIASDASVGRKAKLIGVLPGGEAYSQSYRTFASLLPTRLSEMRGPAHTAFRAILDALAVNRDRQLFEIVMALAAGDSTKGWWDEAINSCVAALSGGDCEPLCTAAYTRCFDGLCAGICDRVLAPLLRYSSPQSCEQFFSTVIKELLAKLYSLKPSLSTHYKSRESVADVTRVLTLLRVAFEKVPPTSIESPSSLLYSATPTDQPWYLVRKVCMACVTLQKLQCPDQADDQFRENIRLFHCANYNCLTTAICLRRPVARLYSCVFNPDVWEKIIDPDVKYQLRLRNTWSNRTKRQPTSIATDSRLNPHNIMTSHTRMTSGSMTSRTRMFLRTLSDNPMRYDLFYDERDDVVPPIELELDDNELNSHECCPTLTSLFCHVASLSHTEWRENTINALMANEVRREAKLLVAQAIINCKEELRPHASDLRPALLAFIADTVSVENGRRLLNRLHVDIIEVLLQWGDTSPEPSQHTNAVLHSLITTCLENRQRENIYKNLTTLLVKMLEVYKSVVNVEWMVFEPYLTDTTSDALKIIQILTKVTKSKVHIPELLQVLITKIEGKQYFGQLSKVAELFGLAMDCQTDHSVLARFRKVLEHTRRSNGGDYVKLLYYSQKGCTRICDERNFRTTIDLLPKITGSEKPKCLQILSSYVSTHPHDDDCVRDMINTIDISELLSQDYCVEAMGVLRGALGGLGEGVRRRVVRQVGGMCGHSKVTVRRAAFEVMLKVFGDLLESPQSCTPKRQKITIRTPIINSIDNDEPYTSLVLCCIGEGLMDSSEDIRSMVKESVARFLYGDCMAVRFTECFLLTIYYPTRYKTSTNNKNKDVSVCLSSLLDLLLSGLREDQRFQNVLLRDEPLATSRPPSSVPSRLLTMSRTYQGTFRSRSHATRRTNQSTSTSEIDVQIPLKSIMDTLLQFAKNTPEAASALCLQILRTLPSDNPNFELGQTLGSQLPTVLAKERSELTPFVVEICRLFVNECSAIDSFKTALDSLQSHTKGTEGESHTKLLYEEYYLCKGDSDMFVLGLYEDCDDVKMEEGLPFCMEDLASVFGKLSNWDDLTIQQRRNIVSEGLPPLWTDKDTFKAGLEDYTGEGWFATMVSAYRSEKEECIKWLRDADRWPRRAFAMSAVTEAIEWLYAVEDTKFPCDILPSDCLAEWAARLMIRAAHLNSLDSDDTTNKSVSRSHELVWCERANETQLSTAVVACVTRNMGDLFHSETLPWLRQKAMALRSMGLEQRDDSKLKKALSDAETYTPKFMEESSPDCIIAMNKLILQLNQDLKSLSTEKINKIIKEVDRQSTKTNIQSSAPSLSSIYEIAMTYYDGQWDSCTDTAEKDNILDNMTSILRHVVDMNIPHADIFLATILNRFENCNLVRESTAKLLLDITKQLIDNLDDFSIKELRCHSSIFPSHLLNAYPYMSERDDATLDMYKECFQLVNDAEYLLLEYCYRLQRALIKNDLSGWMETFDRMKVKMFDNPYAGTDYQLLTKYKNKLCDIENFEISSSHKSKAQSILKDIIRELQPRNRQTVLRLTQMCPSLGSSRVSDPRVGKLLGLPDGVCVVKFDEQVPVFTDSIRRPAVLKALLSDGTTRRYLHKSGESLYADAAVQRVQTVANNICGASVVGYKVTPLSEDCGLIEYLEDYERVRSLITEVCDLNTILDTVPRPADDELILSTSITTIHTQLCEKAPAKSLRSAIQLHSASTQDFIAKKQRFQETLASMTILNWILGVGDRHLQNIMYGVRDGSVCGVDLASCAQASEGPARLTRTVVAVCDRTVLESRLQKLLGNLRNSSKLLLPVTKIAFKRLGPQFDEKIEQITSILAGRCLSHHITLQIIEKSNLKYKSKYTELFNNVFTDYVEKDVYSVEEQITGLLRHCTDPRMLGVIRSGWEPWV